MLSSKNGLKALMFVSVAFLGMSNTERALATAVSLQNGTSTFAQSGFGPGTTYDNNTSTAWAINGGQSSDQTIVWEAISDVVGAGGSNLTFTLNMSGIAAKHTISKFRLSVTADNRSNFADGAAVGGDVTATWLELVLLPGSVTDTDGASFTINGDNTVSVGGTNPDDNNYIITATSSLTAITGFRLETFVNPTFVGRSANGNIALGEFQVDAVAIPVPEPSSILMTLIGICAFWGVRRK